MKNLFVPFLLVVCLVGCADEESLARRRELHFSRGLSAYKRAKEKGLDSAKPAGGAKASSLGMKYAHYFALPAALEPLMNEKGKPTFEKMKNSSDPDAKLLAEKCLEILAAKRKHSFHLDMPFKSSLMHYHYD